MSEERDNREGEEQISSPSLSTREITIKVLHSISKNRTPFFKTKNLVRYNLDIHLTSQHIAYIIKKLRNMGLVEIYRIHSRHYIYRRLFEPQELPDIIDKIERGDII